ncbi:TetR/AcrR family transcriptional regulator [Paenibacillus glycanilyticus]|uniref:HTH tetR-type domain-containing protein n=1 Tax=Paenibacillus glycanilyticus TaxID=126569 RepID=A0ABQ6GL24_9BACL|nr:TetR/AcrR family transcriptional regulator C-terminal domain-containing protein [Paenibacillus glycanilyticus]GLX70940.1 hypothetical protein MU1_52880 [Paenibacillus glycanilyticus]
MKKQQPQISEDKILECSWELLGEDGIEKLSMRRLADRLGIQAPSLYWYFKSKQSLYQRLANQVSRIIVEEFHSEGDWKEQLEEFAIMVRKVLSRYPCSAQLMMLTLPLEPDMIRFTNRMLLCMEATPLKEGQRLQAVNTLINFVLYFVLDNEQHQRIYSTIVNDQEVLPEGELDRLLHSMSETDAGEFQRMYKDGLFELIGSDESFSFGLNLILLGIEQVIQEQERK